MGSLLRSTVIATGFLIGIWLLFDGIRAFATGSYTVPSSGTYAGQLGPWSNILRGLGIDPLPPWVKAAHVLLGTAWIASTAMFWLSGNWLVLVATATASLWYAPFGTIVGLLVIFYLALQLGKAAT